MQPVVGNLVGKTLKSVESNSTWNKNEIKGPKGENLSKVARDLTKKKQQRSADSETRKRDIQAFFLGPKGENADYFTSLITKSINSNTTFRQQYQMEDTRHITRHMKTEKSFLDAQDHLEREMNFILTKLRDLSPPYQSARYYGHMCWETSIPALAGYFAGMLYNPNNCAYEASPFTTLLEIEAMKHFAEMFQYGPMLAEDIKEEDQAKCSWGHLTCGGTVANCESFWAARNCKFLALSLRKYIQNKSDASADLKGVCVTLANGTQKKLLETTGWELMNIDNDVTMNLYTQIFQLSYPNLCPEKKAEKYGQFQSNVGNYSIGRIGVVGVYDFLRQISDEKWVNGKVPSPVAFLSATKHYSFPKSLSILGFGEGGVHKIPVDKDTRMCMTALRAQLTECLEKHIPVMVVAGIVGTTEESTTDPLCEIYQIREQFKKKGLYFHFHIDGAYGGYFCSMMRKKGLRWNSFSEYNANQLEMFSKSDSVTFDPHKTGYIPYACGGIIYRNHRLRDNLNFSAPYIFTGAEPNMAIYGIEGSKPGAAVTSVYLSLAVMPLERSGHGQLLERTMMNTKIFTSTLYEMEKRLFTYNYTIENNDGSEEQKTMKETFKCYVLPRKYSEKHEGVDTTEEAEAYNLIYKTEPVKMEEKIRNTKYEKYYLELGPDLNIPCFGVNFRNNTSLKAYNAFNKDLINLSKPVGSDKSIRCKELYISETEIGKHNYGPVLYNDFLKRHNLIDDIENESDKKIVFIRSTIMNPFFTEMVGREDGQDIFLNELSEAACQALILHDSKK